MTSIIPLEELYAILPNLPRLCFDQSSPAWSLQRYPGMHVCHSFRQKAHFAYLEYWCSRRIAFCPVHHGLGRSTKSYILGRSDQCVGFLFMLVFISWRASSSIITSVVVGAIIQTASQNLGMFIGARFARLPYADFAAN